MFFFAGQKDDQMQIKHTKNHGQDSKLAVKCLDGEYILEQDDMSKKSRITMHTETFSFPGRESAIKC